MPSSRAADPRVRLVRRMARRLTLLLLPVVVAAASSAAHAQDTLYFRAMQAEQGGRYREAAEAYRGALRGANRIPALLGLERAYAELGLGDSLLPLLDSLIAERPRDATFRAVLLRTHRFGGRPDAARRAFERWVKDVPDDPAPYREYARMLLQDGRAASADSVLQRAQRALGSTRDLETEMAQLRAATGQWELSTQSWRAAVGGAPYLEQAAVFALAPAPPPARLAVRRILAAPPVEVGARRVLAALELSWGAPREAWNALRMLPADTAAVAAWRDFADRAEQADAWLTARDALAAAMAVQPSAETAVRAGNAALAGHDATSALAFAEQAAMLLDSARAAQGAVPLRVRALTELGRAGDAAHIVRAYGRWLPDDIRVQLTRAVALGWVRAGDVAQARAALRTAGADPDDPAAGWLALYDGDLETARSLLRGSRDASAGAVAAMAVLARTRATRAPDVGRAFLALARGDSATAAAAFVIAADGVPDAASLLLATAAQIHAARRDDDAALGLWRAIVERFGQAPEAAEADLEWARTLRRRGDAAGAIARLEHLILTYPQSALVPQARRELELARSGIPSTS